MNSNASPQIDPNLDYLTSPIYTTFIFHLHTLPRVEQVSQNIRDQVNT